MKNRLFVVLFGLTVLLAFVLRFYKLGEIPVSLYWDEAAIGYNAYSISQNLHDEHGDFLPLLFKSFGEYKMPAYIYLTAPIVKVFGLNEISVRFWSAVFGVGAVIFTYFLVIQMFETLPVKKLGLIRPEHVALLSAFLLAISPWHIHFSRVGFEANGLLTCIIAGFYCLFKGRKKSKYIFAGMTTFAVSLYFYRSAIGFLPFLILTFFIIYRKELFSKKNIKMTILSVIAFITIAVPISYALFTPQGLARTNQVSVFRPDNSPLTEPFVKLQQDVHPIIAKTILNRRVAYALDFSIGYFSHFSPQYLFLEGDINPRHNVGKMGVLYLWVLPFILYGTYCMWKLDKSFFFFVIAWIIFAPIPAAISVPTPHALRSLNMLPMPELLTSIGAVTLYFVLKKRFRLLYICLLGLIGVVFFVQYLMFYYGRWGRESSSEWGDGHKQMVLYILPRADKYEKVVISGKHWQPYIYTLFYTQYDPGEYQKSGSSRAFGKYVFGGTAWDRQAFSTELDSVDLKEFAHADKLIVALAPVEYEKQYGVLRKLAEIRNAKGELVFVIAETK